MIKATEFKKVDESRNQASILAGVANNITSAANVNIGGISAAQKKTKEQAKASGQSNALNSKSRRASIEGFMGKKKNPFVSAYDSTRGRGLAGFITNLNIGSLIEAPWETSRPGSKGPVYVKIDIGFAPIHDIPPGLAHDGMMRAPVYNIGRLMNELFDDVYDE